MFLLPIECSTCLSEKKGMNTFSKRIAVTGSRLVSRGSAKSCKVLSSNYGTIVDNNAQQIRNSNFCFQKRSVSEVADKESVERKLSECFTDEIAGEADAAPNAEFREMTNTVEKTFKIIDVQGSASTTLQRQFRNESIEIIFNCQDEGDFEDDDEDDEDEDDEDDEKEEEDEEEEEDPYGINFKVIITKPAGEKMVIQCAAFDRIHINGLRYVSANQLVADTTLYAGPIFDNLDKELKRALYAYLVDRGIDDELAFFICLYSREKEQNEYSFWLKQLALFTSDVTEE